MRTLCLLFCAILVTSCSKESLTNQEQDSTITQLQLDSQSNQDCQGELPKARLTNNGTVNHDLLIFSETGELLFEELEIAPGEMTDWFEFPSQKVLFVVDNDTFTDQKVIQDMANCTVFDMEVGADDALVSQELSSN